MAYQGLGNYSEAEKNYKITIGMYPNLLFPKYLLSEMYFESSQYQKAEGILNDIISSNPKIQNQDTRVIKVASQNLLYKIKNNL